MQEAIFDQNEFYIHVRFQLNTIGHYYWKFLTSIESSNEEENL